MVSEVQVYIFMLERQAPYQQSSLPAPLKYFKSSWNWFDCSYCWLCELVGFMKAREMDIHLYLTILDMLTLGPGPSQHSSQPWSYGNQMSKGPLGVK